MPAINKKYFILKPMAYLFLSCIDVIQTLSYLHQHGAEK
jgi:hypothetical protein